MQAIFKGYVTKSLQEAAGAYKNKTGHEPTVLVTRPEHDLIDQHPSLIFSPFGAANIILVTHLVDYDEFKNYEIARGEKRRLSAYIPEDIVSMESVDLVMQQPVIQRKAPGRPKSGSGICPHCQGEIQDFNLLGYWWGWQLGIEPQYWEVLRLFVFQRDNFICQNCKRTFGMSGLVAHHIVPKEKGGPDSARNLLTLCQPCHKDTKPIFSDEEENES